MDVGMASKYNLTDTSDEDKKILMYRYKIIELAVDLKTEIIFDESQSQLLLDNIKDEIFQIYTAKKLEKKQNTKQRIDLSVITKKAFVGPHIIDRARINLGLYASDNLKKFAFFYKDSQEKLALTYFLLNEEPLDVN